MVIANPQTPFGCEESPDDLMTEITVSPGPIEPIPAMTRREFTAFCEELSKSHNLILVT